MPLITLSQVVMIFLCGDIMTGRGIDQVFPVSCDPLLFESYVRDAREYVKLAERTNGTITQPMGYDTVWGDALESLDRYDPDVRIGNLETSVTTHDRPLYGKGINYRMHPENVACLTALKLDVCILANNHVLDWESPGLEETLRTLDQANLTSVGAGLTAKAAAAPAAIRLGSGGRLLVFAYGSPDAGVPTSWQATRTQPGVNVLRNYSARELRRITNHIRAFAKPSDLVVFSIHWGSNWGYEIPRRHRAFAHALIDQAGVDLIHGHSSHHPRPVEIYHDKLILYGCGDFINDYEGIGGNDEYRGDLVLMHYAKLDRKTGRLVNLRMVPLQTHRFRLRRASAQDARWLHRTLERECRPFGARVDIGDDYTLTVRPAEESGN